MVAKGSMTDRRMMTATEDEITALREATREAHAALKDLKGAIKEGRELVAAIDKMAQIAVEDRLKPVVEKGLEDFGKNLRQAIDVATDSVYERFDKIADLLTGEDKTSKRRGQPSIPELVERRNRERGID
jgi:LPS O-antigen subunit length determinant protein (WzzB/FepE family)